MNDHVSSATAGVIGGIMYTVVRHPYDIVCATAQSMPFSKKFNTPVKVLCTLFKEQPVMLWRLYKGFTIAATGKAVQYSLQFGLYDAGHDIAATYGVCALFLWCQFACFTGFLCQYPILAIKRRLWLRNLRVRSAKITYAQLLVELRQKSATTALFDGFFGTRPFINSALLALLLTTFDLMLDKYYQQ